MAEAYHKLSHPEVEKLKAEAALQNAARQQLLSSPFSDRTAADEASDVKLRTSQVQRLNQSRLDVSLQQVSGHALWNKGLGLADHVCALKPSFVSEHFGNEPHVDEIYSQHFRYDPTIEKNDDVLPSFSRSCLWANSGICEKDPSYTVVKTMVGQMHSVIHPQKIGISPFVLGLRRLSTQSLPDESGSCCKWMIIGCVTAKPISYSGVHIFRIADHKFCMQVRSSIPCTGSVNLAFRDLYRHHLTEGGSEEDFSVEAGFAQFFLVFHAMTGADHRLGSNRWLESSF